MSIKTKATIILSLFISMFVIAAGYLTLSYMKAHLRENIANSQFSLVSSLADSIDDKLSLAHKVLISEGEEISGTIVRDSNKAQAYLDRKRVLLNIFDNSIFIYSPEGLLIAESPYLTNRRGMDFSFRDYIRKTISDGKPHISDPYISLRTKSPAIMMTKPIFDSSGSLLAILGGSLNLMHPNFLGELSSIKVGKSGYLYLYSKDRMMIIHPDKTRMMKKDVPVGVNKLFDMAIEGFEGSGETVNSRGLDALASFKSLKKTNWILAANYPVSDAYAPIRKAEKIFILGTALSILLIILLVRFSVVRLLAPLAAIAGHMSMLSQKTGADRYCNISTKDEIGVLASTFNNMITGIDAQQQALQRNETEMKAANELLENIIEFLPDATFIIGKDKQIIAWNRAIEEMTGVPKKDIIGKDHEYAAVPFYGNPRPYLIDLVGMDDKEIALKYVYVMKKKEVLYAEAFTPALNDGKGAYIWATASPLFDTAGNMIGAIESIRDISDRKSYEEALLSSEEKYRTLFEESKDAVFMSTPEGRFLDMNQAGVELFGYSSKEELLDLDIANDLYFNPEDRKNYERMLYENGFVKDYEIQMKRKDGKKLIVLSTSSIERDEQGTIRAYRGIMRDVTEHKNLEQQLLQAQKMQAVGQLAGGIAHDFNNLLTAIIGYSDLELMKLPEDADTEKNIKIIRDAGEKAASLVRQILAFSRKQVLEMKIVNLNSIVEDMGKLLTRTIGENITLELNIKKQVRNIMADPGQIGQILLNLAVNARDAMPSGGRLSIETADVYLDEDSIKTRQGVAAGNYVQLSVGDTGYGMSREMQDRIFEPFFTTKESSKGTGLGLSTVYGIVQQHNGCIWVYSEEGKGSTFKIYLPAVKGEEKETEKPGSSVMPSGTETILVVDDEPNIRRFVYDMLRPLGYKVLEASCADEALRISNECQDTIDLLLTDLTMPGMNGLELRESFLKKCPAIKVIVMSGYGDDAITRKNIKKEDIIFMQKPLTYKKLATKLRDVLDTKQ